MVELIGLGICILFSPIIIIILWCCSIPINRKNKKIRDRILSQQFVYFKDFENQWIIYRGHSGLKYEDGPGCYIILFFDNPVLDGNFNNYKKAYIGQSVRRYERVHNHFKGNGNPNVYYDIRRGKYVYVQFIPCNKQDMNKIEKHLISIFDKNKLYNKNKGGGKRR